MGGLRFVHAADLHLDSPFTGLQAINTDIGKALQESTFRAFSRIVDLCIKEQVDFLLIAGDVYDGADRSVKAQIRFRDALSRLGEAGIQSYVIHGNHDPLDGWRAKLDFHPFVHIFGDKLERVSHEKDGVALAAIYGMSYPTREVHENLALAYQKQLGDPFAIGLLHANVGNDAGHESYASCTLNDLVRANLDYWALGHIHKREVLHAQAPTIVYPGNPQGRHPGEMGEHGCMRVTVGADGHTDVTFVDTDDIRWIEKDISIDGLESVQDLLDVIEEQIGIRQEEGKNLVCRLRLVGRGFLHRSLREDRLSDMEEVLRETLSQAKPFVWIDRIEDATRPDIDIESRRQGQDFVGDFLRIVEDHRTKSDLKDRLRGDLEELFGHRLGRKYLETLSDDQIGLLLEKAETLCLDLLVKEGGS
jgi:DNA repair exonuclease SbcCD nuclease subunit